MEKILGNFLAQQNNDFPLDCETLDYLQKNIHMAEMLGAIAGDKIILSGCGISGSSRAAGYVFLKTTDFPQGEVLHFEGGDAAHTTMYLDKTAISVTANADPYPNAYTQRTLKAGLGSEQYNWSDFAGLSDKTNRQLLAEIQTLQAQIATLQPAPAGSIMMWPSNTIPTGWHLCDGSSMARADYPALFAVLGTTYGNNDSSSFNLPDMRGLFVAGKGANNYSNLNQKGGANTVALTVSEMPKHNHDTASSVSDGSVTTDEKGAHRHTVESALGTDSTGWRYNLGPETCNQYTQQVQFDNSDALVLSENGAHKHSVALKARGSGNAHENRPPYIVLNYIIKLA